jgi:energy-coupling factor transport system permease protein
VAVVVALTVAPQLVASARSVRRARQLRGDGARGWRAIRTMLVPVLEDALERSLVLAAAMDSRGYGRTGSMSRAERGVTGALVLGGLIGLCIGSYGLLGGGSPGFAGWPTLLLGGALAIAGLRVGARRVPRTRYRPDRWSPRALLVVASGLAAVVAMIITAALGGTGLSPSTVPLAWPELPLVPTLGVLVALLPAALVVPEGTR